MQRHRWLWVTFGLTAGAMTAWLQPSAAQAPASPPDPRPAPYLNLAGPGTGNPISTVDSFSGSVGIAALHGTGTDSHGSPLTWAADMRFMQGFYVARDGVARTGTFCFIWLDVYSGSGPTLKQIHDYHIQSLLPPAVKPTDPEYGPFWTVPVSDDDLRTTPFGDSVTLDLWDQPVSDSFQPSGPVNLPAQVTVHLRWRSTLKASAFSNRQRGFAGIYAPADVAMDWSAAGPTSAQDSTAFGFQSTAGEPGVDFAAVGREATGSLAGP